MKKWPCLVATMALMGTALLWSVRSIAGGQDWSDFNGNAMAQKYSTAGQINTGNVKQLAVAWSIHTGDVSRGEPGRRPKTAWQSTPLFVNGLVYVSTPLYRVFAVAPDTGKVKWIYAAKTISNDPASKFHGTNRGIAYWAAADPVAGSSATPAPKWNIRVFQPPLSGAKQLMPYEPSSVRRLPSGRSAATSVADAKATYTCGTPLS